MKKALKDQLLDNLDTKCSNMAICIVSLSSQGYLVNSIKTLKLKLNTILQQQIKYIESFPNIVERRVINNISAV